MLGHGHAASDARHLGLHRVALDKLRQHSELRKACLALLDRWLAEDDLRASRPWLERWNEMLSSWSIERIAGTVLDEDRGQTLRQCSPLGPALTPRERWAALKQIDLRLARGAERQRIAGLAGPS